MEPIEPINIDGDSSFQLMPTAQARGHRLWHFEVRHIALHEGGRGKARLFARARQVRERGGREAIIAPDSTPLTPKDAQSGPIPRRGGPALVKALGRAFRWKRLLDDSTYASVSDIARVETLHRTYAGEVLRLTLLAPENVEAIVEGRQPNGVTLPVLLGRFPIDWSMQRLKSAPKTQIVPSDALPIGLQFGSSCSLPPM